MSDRKMLNKMRRVNLNKGNYLICDLIFMFTNENAKYGYLRRTIYHLFKSKKFIENEHYHKNMYGEKLLNNKAIKLLKEFLEKNKKN